MEMAPGSPSRRRLKGAAVCDVNMGEKEKQRKNFILLNVAVILATHLLIPVRYNKYATSDVVLRDLFAGFYPPRACARTLLHPQIYQAGLARIAERERGPPPNVRREHGLPDIALME